MMGVLGYGACPMLGVGVDCRNTSGVFTAELSNFPNQLKSGSLKESRLVGRFFSKTENAHLRKSPKPRLAHASCGAKTTAKGDFVTAFIQTVELRCSRPPNMGRCPIPRRGRTKCVTSQVPCDACKCLPDICVNAHCSVLDFLAAQKK